MELLSFHTPFYISEIKHLIYSKTEKRKQIIKKQKNQRKNRNFKKDKKNKAINKKNIIKNNRKGYEKKKMKKWHEIKLKHQKRNSKNNGRQRSTPRPIMKQYVLIFLIIIVLFLKLSTLILLYTGQPEHRLPFAKFLVKWTSQEVSFFKYIN